MSMTARFTGFMLALALLTVPCAWGATGDYSAQTRNMSGPVEPAGTVWEDSTPEVAVSGQYVHLAWLSVRQDDNSVRRICYRRSTDGGVSFGPVQALVNSTPGVFFGLDLPVAWKWLAVDGANVHLVYIEGWPSTLSYIHSTDNGQTFSAPRVFASAYQSYSGAVLDAAGGTVTLAWSSNSNDAPYNKNVIVAYSTDGGANFTTRTVSHSDSGVTSPIYSLTLEDMVRSGNNIYVIYKVGDVNWYSSQGHFYFSASNDGGATFRAAQRINVAAADGNYYGGFGLDMQDYQYSPNIAAVGTNVWVVWLNEDKFEDSGPGSYTLRVRRSTDSGATLGDPQTLKTYIDVFSGNISLNAGESTIAAQGNTVTVVSMDSGGTHLWRSTNAGASYSTEQLISTGGWWPLLQVDPSPAAAGNGWRLVNYYYYKSVDGGANFSGGVTPEPRPLMGWNNPQMAVGADGAVHYVAQGKYVNTDDWDIFYRRLPLAPAPGVSKKAISLTSTPNFRFDNMQVAASPDINVGSAMTVEFWIKAIDGESYHYETFLRKTRSPGAGSYEMGAWGGFQIYGRLVTTNSADQYWGNWLGTGVTLPTNTWTHIAMTYDAGAGANNWRIYVNGVQKAATTLTGAIVTDKSPLIFGGNSQYYLGTAHADELRIWNRARTGAEIAADMTRQLAGSEAGLVAYYTFNDTTKDSTGRGNDGVLMYQESYVTDPTPGRPAIVSVSPNSGMLNAGAAQTFTAVYTDANGVADIKNAYLMVNTAISGAGGAYLYYVRATGRLYLRDDANTTWGAGSVIGAGGTTLSNSQCTVDCLTSGATASGNNLTLTLKITFKPAFGGARNIYMYSDGNGGLSSGWVQKGTITVNAPPATSSVAPVEGNAQVNVTQTLSATYSDVNGANDIKTAYLMVNTSNTGAGAAYIYYVKSSNRLYLRDDANTSWGAGSVVGAGGTTLSNSWCAIYCASSGLAASGNNVTLTVKVVYYPVFVGAKNIYAYVDDNHGLNSGWAQKGTVNVQNPAAPTAVSVAPASGTAQHGVTQTYTLTYSDANGASDIKTAYMLINTTNSSAGAVYIYYNRGAGRLYLMNDANNSWGAGSVLGAGGTTLTNSRCTVACDTSGSAASGNNLAITLKINFTTGFLGAKNIYEYVNDIGGLNSGWVARGTVSVN